MADSNYSSFSSRDVQQKKLDQSNLTNTMQTPTLKPSLFQLKTTIRNPEQYLIIDPKSEVRAEFQIKHQVTHFTKNTNVGKTDIASMDKFTEMIKLEREFGKLHLGHDPLP